jgi:hypothetical protein
VLVLEDHVRTHLIDAGSGSRARGGDAAAELIDVLRTYLK